jgi:uncharacterized membrane protein
MKQETSKPFIEAIGLGIMAGMRSNAGPAAASHILSQQYSAELDKSPLKFMQSPQVSNVLKVLALAELVGDKLPNAGNRIVPVSVIFRCSAGALAGASMYKASGNNAFKGALLGAAAAFGSTFASFYFRKDLVQKTHIYDPVLGVVEDTLVLGGAVYLSRNAEDVFSELQLE